MNDRQPDVLSYWRPEPRKPRVFLWEMIAFWPMYFLTAFVGLGIATVLLAHTIKPPTSPLDMVGSLIGFACMTAWLLVAFVRRFRKDPSQLEIAAAAGAT